MKNLAIFHRRDDIEIDGTRFDSTVHDGAPAILNSFEEFSGISVTEWVLF